MKSAFQDEILDSHNFIDPIGSIDCVDSVDSTESEDSTDPIVFMDYRFKTPPTFTPHTKGK